MTDKLFEKWPLRLDKQFASARRNIILSIDNRSIHPKHLQSELKFINLAFFFFQISHQNLNFWIRGHESELTLSPKKLQIARNMDV